MTIALATQKSLLKKAMGTLLRAQTLNNELPPMMLNTSAFAKASKLHSVQRNNLLEMAMFNFDPTIKLGDVLTIASFLGVGISAFYNIRGRLDMHNLRLTTMETSVKSVLETLGIVATQKVEIDHIKDDVRELRHGKGFVTEALNGEYTSRGKRV